MNTSPSRSDSSRTTRFFLAVTANHSHFSISFSLSLSPYLKMSESEELSKNALKKKLKAEEAAKKKATKDAEKAAKAAEQPKKEKLTGDEIELDPTQYYENRLRTVNNLGVCLVRSSLLLISFSLSLDQCLSS